MQATSACRAAIIQDMNRDEEIAWAAGLFEGEGTFGFRKLRRGGRAPADIRLGMVDRDTVEEFARIMECGTIRTQARESHQDLHIWIVSGMSNIKKVIELLGPYLRKRRKAAADEALAYILDDSRNRRELELGKFCVNGHKMTNETLVRQDQWCNYCRICRTATRKRYEAKQRSRSALQTQ